MKTWQWFTLSVVIILLDQSSKYWAMASLLPYQPIAVIPMLNWTLAFNSGAAFSVLHHTGAWHYWFFLSLSTLISIGIAVWILRVSPRARCQLLGLSLILGGALGNLFDRIRFNYVVDFIDLYYKTHHWPIFNLADSAICIGAVLLFFGMRSKPKSFTNSLPR